MFDKIFKKHKLTANTSEHIKLCKDKRVIEMSERDFNRVIRELSAENITAGNSVSLTAPDGTRVIFIIRKNKNNGK